MRIYIVLVIRTACVEHELGNSEKRSLNSVGGNCVEIHVNPLCQLRMRRAVPFQKGVSYPCNTYYPHT